MRPLAVLLLFAAMPALAAPPPHLKGLPAGLVQGGTAPAALAGEGGRSPLWLPGGARAFAVEREVEAGADVTRFGRIDGVGSAAVTLGPHGGFARVTQGATVWQIEYRDGVAWALRTGAGGLALAAFDDDALSEPDLVPAKAASARSAVMPRTVDFAALYDAGFAARYPGTLARTRIAHFVALANQAFVDSDVMVTLRLVHARAAPGAVAPNIGDNVHALYWAQAGGTFAGVDVRGLRADHGADLVSFFRTHDLYARGFCGFAFFPGTSRAGVSVVVDGPSGGSVCDEYTFAHEVGHNLGARHQLAADSAPGAGHALVRPGQLATIMASIGTGRPDRARQLNYFSNPRIACGNLPCGSAAEDNAGVMNENVDRVANYLATRARGTAVRPGPTLADSDGDGAIDRVDAFPFDPARIADRDGDGSADADDAFPDNSTEWRDSDLGGQGDNADADDDNDGVGDAADRFPLDPLESADADNDGHGDTGDAFDADPREQRDTDGDGTGDRADADDDGDGLADVATLAADADGELLVADGASDRLLRFDGATLAPLGTLLQLGAGEVSFRSGIAAAPDGAVYFVGASQLRVLDRLRGTPAELMLDTASHPLVGTGFPLSPIVLATGDVMLGEMGRGLLLALRPAPSRAVTPLLNTRFVGGAPHVARDAGNGLFVQDGSFGNLTVFTQSGDPLATDPTPSSFGFPLAEPASGDIAWAGGVLYWVDRRDGAVRSIDPSSGAIAGFAIADADAAAITISPGGTLYVARRTGGVRAYQLPGGADLGLRVSVADAPEPVELAFAPRILDDDLPPIVPPPMPPGTSDPATTPAVGGSLPPPPPCTTDCIKPRGTGGSLGPGLLALLVLARRWRRGTRDA